MLHTENTDSLLLKKKITSYSTQFNASNEDFPRSLRLNIIHKQIFIVLVFQL